MAQQGAFARGGWADGVRAREDEMPAGNGDTKLSKRQQHKRKDREYVAHYDDFEAKARGPCPNSPPFVHREPMDLAEVALPCNCAVHTATIALWHP